MDHTSHADVADPAKSIPGSHMHAALIRTHDSLHLAPTNDVPMRVAVLGTHLACAETQGLVPLSNGQVRHLLPFSVTYLCKGANVTTGIVIKLII